MRLDRVLVERGIARSRAQAQSLIADGVVTLDGRVTLRAAADVGPESSVVLTVPIDHYVCRAAHKLAGALDVCAHLGLDVTHRRALDAGASTGGFTQVLLELGAANVVALDVGHDQLAPQIAADPRVTVREGVNVRDLDPADPDAGVSLVVADLSFISLELVIAPLVGWCAPPADLVLMVKPQFEVGRALLGAGGVVRDARHRAAAVSRVADAMTREGLVLHHVARSSLPGSTGNVEFFIWGSLSWQAGTAEPHRTRPVLAGEALINAIASQVEREP